MEFLGRSGRSLEHLDYYMALALWKLAILTEGLYKRYLAGKSVITRVRFRLPRPWQPVPIQQRSTSWSACAP